jgi:hypothetical protein
LTAPAMTRVSPLGASLTTPRSQPPCGAAMVVMGR